METNEAPLVSAVVLNLNGMEVLPACLETLSASTYPNLKIYIADNESSDGSPEWARAHFPEVKVVRTGGNLGWSGGNNVGIRKALADGADWIWILNNDIEVEPDCLEQQIEYARGHPSCDILGPLIYYFEPRDKVWFYGGKIDRDRFYADHCASLEEFRSLPQEARYISGCAMLVHKKVFNLIGLIDERFFIYCEDTDFCLRASRAGLAMEVVEKAVMYHKVSAFSGGQGAQTPFQVYQTLRSLLLFWRKHVGWWRFHRDYCKGHLGKWVNSIPELWANEESRPRVEATIDAVWYVLAGKRIPRQRPASPKWFRRLMIRRPWLVAELMAFRNPLSKNA